MKSNFKYYILALLLIFIISLKSFSQNEIIGSWIISSNNVPNTYGFTNYKIDFSPNGILNAQTPLVLSYNNNSNTWKFVASAGGYQCNGQLGTYITDKYFYDNNGNQYTWVTGEEADDFYPDAQLVTIPEMDGKYYLFYSNDQDGGTSDDNVGFYACLINTANGNQSFNTNNFPFNTVAGDAEYGEVAFAISNIIDDERYIFTLTGSNNGELTETYGLEKYLINSTGIFFDETLLEESNENFAYGEYFGYNLEMRDKNETDDPIIAWITTPNSTVSNTKIYIYDPIYNQNDDHYFLDLSNLGSNGSGRIAGIEFSPFDDEPFYMYVSCENLGLIKIDWRTGALIYQYTSGTIDYSHTFIQTGPDGNLYAVANDGNGFGLVSKSSGHNFYPLAFQYPYYVNTNGVITNFRLTHINYFQNPNGGTKYFTLPENDETFLKARVTTTDNLCDIESGSAILYPLGGVPDYSLVVNWDDPYDNQNIWVDVSSLFVFNQTLEYYDAPNLMVGDYQYILTDQSSCEEGWSGTFAINEGDVYDFEQNLLEINSATAPSIYGLSDMVWDQNDNDPNDGFIINNTIMFKHGFKLSGSTTLTINNLRLEFDEDYMAKVIIEPGSKLILNNCTLTNYHCWDPDAKWAGIEVWGNKTAPQTEANQGKLVMNNSTIEHAHEAVQLWKPGDYYKTGGMVYAQNSEFKNNRRAISFLSYIYSHPQFGFEYNYYSQLNQCVFLNDEDYLDDNPFYAFITMWDVKGVNIKVCTFDAGSQNGNGINTIDAGFTLSGNCNNALGCAPAEWERCEFYNFDKAVNAMNTGQDAIYPINIQHSYFFNNNYGAFLSNLHQVLKVNTSEFIVGNNGVTKEKALCGEFFGRGIHIEGSNGFEIENNEFYKNTAANLDDDVLGILALNNPSNHDIIYNNDFNDLKIGNDAVGLNRLYQGDDRYGLEYQCNDNVSNSIDFDVIPININDIEYPGQIYTYMGDDLLYGSARNTYTSTSEDGFEKHWNHMSYESVHYYLHESEDFEGSNYKPTEIETVIGPGPNKYFKIVVPVNGFVNQCSDGSGIHIERTTMTPEEQQEEEIKFATAYQDYEAVESIYNDLKDGGSTEGTSLTIESSQPDDTWELRDNLLGMSPYLSREVLEKAANKTNVLPNSVLLDILAANPDELKKEDFIQFLENKEEPLPDYMIDILRDLSSGTTYKTALLNQMNIQKRNQIDAANKMIKSLVNEEEQDREAIKGWLANMGNLQSDMQIAAMLIAEKNFTEANTLLNLLPDLYNLENDELDRYNADKDLLTLKMQIKQENRNLSQLNSAEIMDLEVLANGKVGMARTSARNILEAFYGYDNFCDCIDRNSNKSSVPFTYKEESESPLKIEATPNPATHYVEFYYELSEIDQDGIIIITDINGKIVQTFTVNNEKGKHAWDTRKIPSGSYIYSLKTKYFEESGKLIIQ